MSIGNKAQSLFELKKLDTAVPNFFVVPTSAYDRYVVTKNMDPADRSFIMKELDKISSATWIVRSSSTKEDGSQHSFAGLFESYMDIQTKEQVVEAIMKCWQSVTSERVLKYSQRIGLTVADIQMAVIVQEFVEPDWAGVLFTAHPTTGNDKQMLIEACQGRGERLVSGHVNPSRFILPWFGSLESIQVENLENIQVDLPTMNKLRGLGQKVQAHYGKPQDIEFAVKNGKIYLVQSRDITRIQFSPEMGEWTTADFRDGGVSSEVVSPLMWSLYERIFSSSMPNYFYKLKMLTQEQVKAVKWYEVFYGRPYWNLAAVKDIMKTLPGFNERNFDQDLSIPAAYEGDGVTTPLTLSGLLRAIPTLFALDREFKLQEKRSDDLLKNFGAIEERYLGLKLTDLSDTDLHNIFKQLVDEDYVFVESEYFQTIYNASNAKMEFMSELNKCRKIDSTLEYVHLIADLGQMGATQPPRDLAEICKKLKSAASIQQISELLKKNGDVTRQDLNSLPKDLAKELTGFIDNYYYHSERELDLRVPRWSENVRFILTTLKTLMESENINRLSDLSAHKTSTYQLALAKMRSAHTKTLSGWIPGQWLSVEKKLNRVRRFLWMREEIRSLSTRMYYFIRVFALELAKRRALDDIFYCSYQELLLLSGDQISIEELRNIAQDRKLYALGYRDYTNPNEIGYRYNHVQSLTPAPLGAQTTLTGIGCSAGRVKAAARVLRDISEAENLQSGEILVVRFTDPGWTPLFSLASGVVCETGGLLSHAALISREYGIPSVLNVSKATTHIKDGQSIEIDGTRGEVYLL